MSANKHTPGPWSVYVNDHRSAVVRAMFPDGQEKCPIGKVEGVHALGNARLIAAAPDLLEALQAVLAILPVCPQNTGIAGIEARYNCAVVGARAAIAKATGENE